eukprot:GSA120T00015038001.1
MKFPVSRSGSISTRDIGSSSFADRHLVASVLLGPVDLERVQVVSTSSLQLVPLRTGLLHDLRSLLSQHSREYVRAHAQDELNARTHCEDGTYNATIFSSAEELASVFANTSAISALLAPASSAAVSIPAPKMRGLAPSTLGTTIAGSTTFYSETGDRKAKQAEKAILVRPASSSSSSSRLLSYTSGSIVNGQQAAPETGLEHVHYVNPSTQQVTVCPLNVCVYLKTNFGRWVQVDANGDVKTRTTHDCEQTQCLHGGWECFYFTQEGTDGHTATGASTFFLKNMAHGKYLWGTQAGSVGTQSWAQTGERWSVLVKQAEDPSDNRITMAYENYEVTENAGQADSQMSQEGSADGDIKYGLNGDWERFFTRDMWGNAACHEPKRPSRVFTGFHCNVGHKVKIRHSHSGRLLHMAAGGTAVGVDQQIYLPATTDTETDMNLNKAVWYMTNCGFDAVCFRSMPNKHYLSADGGSNVWRVSGESSIAGWHDWERMEMRSVESSSNTTCVFSLAHAKTLSENQSEADADKRDQMHTSCGASERWEIVDATDATQHRCHWYTTTTTTSTAPVVAATTVTPSANATAPATTTTSPTTSVPTTPTATTTVLSSHGVWYPQELLKRAQRRGYYAGPPGCRVCRDNEELASYLDEVIALCPEESALRRANQPVALCACLMNHGACMMQLRSGLVSGKLNSRPVMLGETLCPFYCAHYNSTPTCHTRSTPISSSASSDFGSAWAPRGYTLEVALQQQPDRDTLRALLAWGEGFEGEIVATMRDAFFRRNRDTAPDAIRTPAEVFYASSPSFYRTGANTPGTLQPNAMSLHLTSQFAVTGCAPLFTEAPLASPSTTSGGSTAAVRRETEVPEDEPNLMLQNRLGRQQLHSSAKKIRRKPLFFRRLDHDPGTPAATSSSTTVPMFSQELLRTMYTADNLPYPAERPTPLPPRAYTYDLNSAALEACLKRTGSSLFVPAGKQCYVACSSDASTAGASSSSISSAAASPGSSSAASSTANYFSCPAAQADTTGAVAEAATAGTQSSGTASTADAARGG